MTGLDLDAIRHELPERHPVELAAGSVVIERYHWRNAATGKRGVRRGVCLGCGAAQPKEERDG